MEAVNHSVFREGAWSLCSRSGWPDNGSFENIVCWTWLNNDDRYLIVANLSDSQSQAQVQVPWTDATGATWLLVDLLTGATYEREGHAMTDPGLYVDLGPWNCHFFQCLRAHKNEGTAE
jgi:hypothetical protein